MKNDLETTFLLNPGIYKKRIAEIFYHFFPDSYVPGFLLRSLGVYSRPSNEIIINCVGIYQSYSDSRLIDIFVDIISHEVIHYVIDIIESYKATLDYDSIAKYVEDRRI